MNEVIILPNLIILMYCDQGVRGSLNNNKIPGCEVASSSYFQNCNAIAENSCVMEGMRQSVVKLSRVKTSEVSVL